MPGNKVGKRKLVIVELYNEDIHGLSNHTDYDINTHYLIIETFSNTYNNDSDVSDDEDISEINTISRIIQISNLYNRRYRKIKRLKHSIIRNYPKMILSTNYIKPEIAECIYLKNNEYVAILKTFWIRLIQRTWKRIFVERKNVILKRKMLSSLNYRQLNGKWPSYCYNLPSLYGMLKV